jgi:crotonobetainyl-CoA:carnitine CoA-transferase CaiB-like acyl-CoA transferase
MRPLDGITVVTLEHAIAAPFCTRQLADLGARVIKVERPEAAISRAPTTSACVAWRRISCGPIARRRA